MRVRGVVGAALLCFAIAAGVEAGLPKPVRLVDRMGSRGAPGVRSGKYNTSTWGNRWNQSLRNGPLVLSPYVRRY